MTLVKFFAAGNAARLRAGVYLLLCLAGLALHAQTLEHFSADQPRREDRRDFARRLSRRLSVVQICVTRKK